MNKRELELFRLQAKVAVLESFVANLYVAATRTPAERESLLHHLNQLVAKSEDFPVEGFEPEMADLLSAERNEALEHLVNLIKTKLK